MSTCNCKPKLAPRNLATPLVDQYVALLSPQDLAEVAAQAMKLMKASDSYGLQEAAACWGAAFMNLLGHKGWLKSLDSLRNNKLD